jgi:hypothetical protein
MLHFGNAQTGRSPFGNGPNNRTSGVRGEWRAKEVRGPRYRLDNGARVLLFPEASRPTVTVNMTVLVGSRHEGYGETGMAHLLEHMVFKGTLKHPNVPKALRDHGASFNGTTNTDRTNYFETMPATDKNLEFGIALECDRLVNSFIKRDDLLSEMTVVRNEFERGENNPGYILNQRITSHQQSTKCLACRVRILKVRSALDARHGWKHTHGTRPPPIDWRLVLHPAICEANRRPGFP